MAKTFCPFLFLFFQAEAAQQTPTSPLPITAALRFASRSLATTASEAVSENLVACDRFATPSVNDLVCDDPWTPLLRLPAC